ncbi:hypothetical protein P9112_007384 [Eukaryota sp. TZLM1-RC]
MSSHAGSAAFSATVATRIKTGGFSFVSLLSTCLRKHNFLAIVFFFLEFLQLFGIQINQNFPHLHKDLDVRPFFHFISFSSYDTRSWSLLSYNALSYAVPTLALISLVLFAVGFWVSNQNIKHSFLLVSVRVYLELLSFFYLPLTMTTFTHLLCSDNTVFHAIPIDSCWSTGFVFLKFLFIFSWGILTCVVLFKSSMIGDFIPNSKKVFSCVDRRFLSLLVLIKIFLSFSLVYFDHLPIIFNLFYPISAILLGFVLFKTIPFFKTHANGHVAFCVGALFFSSSIWVATELVGINWNQWLFTGIYYSFCLLSGFGFRYFIIRTTLSRTHQLLSYRDSLASTNREDEVVEEGDESYGVINEEVAQFNCESSIFSRLVKTPYDAEVLIRWIHTKRSVLEHDVVFCRNLIDHAMDRFPESLHVYLVKCVFELSAGKDYISTIAQVGHIGHMDLDVRLDYQFYFQHCKKIADNLRREQSTGQSLDSSSFLVLQRQLRSASDLHKDCLDYLAVFWNHLLTNSGKTNLSALPPITEKIYKCKKEAESCFSKLVVQYPGNKEILMAYSKFVREITLDDELADNLQTQCELVGSDGQSSIGDQSSDMPSTSGRSTFSRSRKKRRRGRRRKGQSVMLTVSDTRDDESSSSTEKLQFSVHIALITLTIVVIFAFFFLRFGIETVESQFNYLFEADHFGASQQDVAYQSFLLSSVLNGNDFNVTENELRQRIIEEAEHAIFHLRRLLIGHEISPEVNDLFSCPGGITEISALAEPTIVDIITSPSVPRVTSSATFPHVPVTAIVSLYELSLDYSRRAFMFGRNESERVDIDIRAHDSLVSFLLDNRNELADGVLRLLSAVREFSVSELSFLLVVNVALIIGVVTVIVIIGVFLFGRTLHAIEDNKVEIFNLFLYVPPQFCKEILSHEKFADSIAQTKEQNGIEEIQDEEVCQNSITTPRPNQEPLLNQLEEYSGNDINLQIFPTGDQSIKTDKLTSSKTKSSSCKTFSVLFTLLFIIFSLIGLLYFASELNHHASWMYERSFTVFEIAETASNLLQSQLSQSKNILSFAATGDLRFYHRYFSLKYSTTAANAMSTLRRTALNEENAAILGDFLYYQSLIEYKELVTLKILQLAFGYTDFDMPEVSDFTYDITNEQDWQIEALEYYDVDFWYSSLQNDSLLEPEELQNLGRSIVSNRRHLELDSKRVSQLIRFTAGVFNVFDDQVDEVVETVNFEVTSMLSSFGIVGLVLVVLLFATFKYLRLYSLKKAAVALLTASIVLVVVAAGSLYLTSTNFSNLSDGIETFTAGEIALFEIIDNETLSEYFISMYSQYGDVAIHNLAMSHRNDVNSALEMFSELSNDSNDAISTVFKELYEVMANNFFTESRFLEDVSITLTASGFEIPEALIPQSLTWNLTNQDNYYLIRSRHNYYDFDNFYSDYESDLALPKEEQILLSRSILNSDIYFEFADEHHDIIIDAVSNFGIDSRRITNETVFAFNAGIVSLIIISIICILLLIFTTIVYFLAMSIQRKRKAHIVQQLKFKGIGFLKLEYISALTLLSILVALFFFLAVYVTRESDPRVVAMHLAGERFVLTKMTQASSLLLLGATSPQQSRQLLEEIEILRLKHFEVLFGNDNFRGSVGNQIEQDELLFVTEFSTDSFLEASGLHVLFENFLYLADRLSTQSQAVTADNPDLLDFIDQGRSLHYYLYESLTYYRDESLAFLDRFDSIILIVFVAILLVLLGEYLFIFRKMINRLYEEEQTVMLLLSMIPQQAIDQVSVIRDYLDQI